MNEYEVFKLMHPVTTTPRKGVNVHELVKTTFPKQYLRLFLFTFDWNDLDGVLDYLYGERELGFISSILGIPKTEITKIINLIEAHCEVKK